MSNYSIEPDVKKKSSGSEKSDGAAQREDSNDSRAGGELHTQMAPLDSDEASAAEVRPEEARANGPALNRIDPLGLCRFEQNTYIREGARAGESRGLTKSTS